jgi:hypothetical protein
MKIIFRKAAFTVILAVTQSFFGVSAALADPDDLSETEQRALRAQVSIEDVLHPSARQLSQQLGILPHLEKLQQLSERDKRRRGEPTSPETTTLRLEVVEVVVTTMLQCQEVIGQIDSEIAEANESAALIATKRDKVIKLNNLAVLFANGIISYTGTMLQMPETISEQPGEVLEAGASAMSAGLGALGMIQQSGMKLSCGIRPNMLAKVFKRPNTEETEYPDVIWSYLNEPLPGVTGGRTRRELLIERWEKIGHLPDDHKDKERAYKRVVAGTVEQKKTVTLNMLGDRVAMLADLRATVSQIYKELLNLMLTVRAL